MGRGVPAEAGVVVLRPYGGKVGLFCVGASPGLLRSKAGKQMDQGLQVQACIGWHVTWSVCAVISRDRSWICLLAPVDVGTRRKPCLWVLCTLAVSPRTTEHSDTYSHVT